MTEPQIDTLQYREFLRRLNKALPLELTIRAARLACPRQFEALAQIDMEIRTAWTQRGFTEAEIVHDGLAERCLDRIQLGWSERRSPFEIWPAEVAGLIAEGIHSICEEYRGRIVPESYPFARRYRYADLVRGMDVDRVLKDYLAKLQKLRLEPEGDGIPLGNFVLSFREPIPVVPGAVQMICDDAQQPEYLGLMLRYDMPLSDVRAALLDFEYHYAEFRIREHGLRDETSQRLLDSWALPGPPSREDLVGQAHQVHPKLAGLHSYDRFIGHGGPDARGARARALDETIGFHPESLAPERSRAGKWLDNTRKDIERIAEALRDS
ncbi:hypothetical protein ACXIUT_13050 [Achromobacter denitrificans]